MPRLLAIFALLSATLGGEIIDRIAVIVDTQLVTLSDIQTQLRASAFLSDQPPEITAQARKAAAERLVDQALFRREMEIARFKGPPLPEAREMLENLKKRRFKSEAEFHRALREYGLSETDLLNQIHWQLTVLDFIDFRFAPNILLTDAELQEYYNNTFLPEWRAKTRMPPPTLAEAREELEKMYNSRKADQAVEEWLKNAREQARIVYQQEAFQ